VISNQSEKIESRKHLEQIFDAAKSDTTISRPDYWGGFLVKPVRFEFWQGRESRLHDRILYEKVTESWQISRLAP